MTIGIQKITVHRAESFLNNLEQRSTFDVNEDFLVNKVGMLKLRRMGKEQDCTDLGVAAVLPLFEKHGLLPEDVECLVVVSQNPDGYGLPHSSAILHQKLGLEESCVVFDVSLGCTGFVQGLSIAKSFMEGQGFSNGLLVTADPYSKIIDEADRDTAMLFGDGATATWLSDTPQWQVGPFDFGTRSRDYKALHVKADGFLEMNGRAVFNFAASQVPLSVKRLLTKAGVDITEVDMFLLHQGSRYIVETIAARLGVPERTPFVAADYGNTVSSSVPMLLAEHVAEDAERLLLSGFGVGLAWASCLLERSKC